MDSSIAADSSIDPSSVVFQKGSNGKCHSQFQLPFFIFSCLIYDVCSWCAIAQQNTKLESELLTIQILEYIQPK